ncbi:probable ATP-dependent RNA helicase DDX31 [Neocloeon triangulifer]|uniref:probable ATP-dependent RNA helicase DDX31 n=1 Tax=Neocloeon triangulifer TaxID=2078957 RepID=UPI00286F0317|nr:probable ATP-dependent RNA helicase DDX31 [Neocloeon triangulifer]XP_059487933.1 probable ATP-dependent RNA helicase DDX31 [Neocloeon triangulifer]XP_059487934.1 probable ATP-dependent RNA helicase DDX31 [Neocloeon triangulifer]
MDAELSLNVFSEAPARSAAKKTKEKKRALESESEDWAERPKKVRKEGGEGRVRRGGVTSSLFTNNPEIPRLPPPNVKKQKHQPLFSQLTFDQTDLHPFMVKKLEELLGSNKMTEVQRLAIPVILSGKDSVVRSQTGSGKTLAYSCPIIQDLQSIEPKLTRNDGIRALIIVPTRELALQSYEWLSKLTKTFNWLVPGVLCGGEKKKSEKARMRKGITLLVSTPGRLLDHLTNTQSCSLSKVKHLVLDEADRLLDLGYEEDVAKIVQALNEQGSGSEVRQTILLSATLNAAVERLAGLALKDSKVFVDASSETEQAESAETETLSVPDSLDQWFLAIPPKLRLVVLASFVASKCELTNQRKMLIFCATQDMVDYLTPLLASALSQKDTTEESSDEDDDDEEAEAKEEKKSSILSTNIHFFRLHGNMTQKDRTETFKTFRDTHSGVLLCTDVASRGLDLPRVDWIVQLTAPPTPQDYVHRVGRTARVGHKGSAVIFLALSELGYVTKLEEHGIRLKEMDATKVLDELLKLVPREVEQKRIRGSRHKTAQRSVEAVATDLQVQFEQAVLDDKQLHELACKAYVSWVRFYASYPAKAKAYFHYKALHLGHYAKSFALRDAPSRIGGIGKRNWEKDQQQSSERREFRRPNLSQHRNLKKSKDRNRELIVSEYASGI